MNVRQSPSRPPSVGAGSVTRMDPVRWMVLVVTLAAVAAPAAATPLDALDPPPGGAEGPTVNGLRVSSARLSACLTEDLEDEPCVNWQITNSADQPSTPLRVVFCLQVFGHADSSTEIDRSVAYVRTGDLDCRYAVGLGPIPAHGRFPPPPNILAQTLIDAYCGYATTALLGGHPVTQCSTGPLSGVYRAKVMLTDETGASTWLWTPYAAT